MRWTPGPRLTAIEAALERESGPGGALYPDTLLSQDDEEAFPARAAAVLDQCEVHRFYVDRRNDGELEDLFELTHLVRLLARRDLTLAVGHAKTFLGAASVWLAGDEGQRRGLSERVRGGAIVSWGLTERGHGGDLLSDELSASSTAGGWLLTGEKWLINNANRSELATVLARTSPAGGPRGFSLILFDKHRADSRTWAPTPKVATHGIRGADISGLAFERTPVDADAVIGPLGSGIETTLKALQLTRTMCCGLSLGALDHALALGVAFLRERNLYGTTLAEVPHLQQELGRCLAALYTAEAVCFAVARTAGNAADELSLVAAAGKALVPELCQGAISTIGELLGVRAYLSADGPYRSFQKIDRDHRIIGIFDGSTAVCRNLEIDHFPMLARSAPAAATAAATGSGLLDRPSAPWDPDRLRLLARSCSLLSTMTEDCEAIAAQATEGRVPDAAAKLAAAALDGLRHVRARMAEVERGPRQLPQAAFDLARDFELCLAAAAVCRLWTHAAAEGEKEPEPWSEGRWLTAALLLLVERLPVPDEPDPAWPEVFGALGRSALDGADRDVLSIFGPGDAR